MALKEGFLVDALKKVGLYDSNRAGDVPYPLQQSTAPQMSTEPRQSVAPKVQAPAPVYGPTAPATKTAPKVNKPYAPPAPVDTGFQSKLDPNDPAFIGGEIMRKAREASGPAFNPEPITTVDSSDFADAYQDPEKLPNFFGKQYEGIEAQQGEVARVRGEQETNVQTLETARLREGYDTAQAEVRASNEEMTRLNSVVANLEYDVRRDLGSDVSESFIQAEVKRRLGDLEPVLNRAQSRQQLAQANRSIIAGDVQARFGAARADATEAVGRAEQILGFKTDNINAAVTLYSNIKQFELMNDYQINTKRDSARAMASTLLSSPRGFKDISDKDIEALEIEGGFGVGVLKGIKDNIKQNKQPLFQNVDDAGNLNLLYLDLSTGVISTDRITGFAKIIPKATAASAASLKAFENASPAFQNAIRSAYGDLSTYANQEGVSAAKFLTFGMKKAGELGQFITNEADRIALNSFVDSISGAVPETARERASGTVEGELEALTE